MSGVDDELAAIAAEMDALDAAAAERSAASAKERRLEAARIELADKKAIANAEAELGAGKFAVIRTVAGAVIVKRPNHMHYRRFINLKEPSSDDAAKLVLTCLVYPSKAAFEVLSEELPAVPVLAAGAVVDLAAGRSGELSGKS